MTGRTAAIVNRRCPLWVNNGHRGELKECFTPKSGHGTPPSLPRASLGNTARSGIGRLQADTRPHGPKLFTSSSRMTRNAAGKLICEPSGKIIAALVAVKEFPLLAAT